MVRLLPGRYGKVISRLLEFQSHNGAIAAQAINVPPEKHEKVSIPQWCDCCPEPFVLVLTFSVVSIPQWCDCCYSLVPDFRDCRSGFNPTMVRLLLYLCACFKLRNVPAFQSHNGAIAAEQTCAFGLQPCFNPTMVRLLPCLKNLLLR